MHQKWVAATRHALTTAVTRFAALLDGSPHDRNQTTPLPPAAAAASGEQAAARQQVLAALDGRAQLLRTRVSVWGDGRSYPSGVPKLEPKQDGRFRRYGTALSHSACVCHREVRADVLCCVVLCCAVLCCAVLMVVVVQCAGA